ncbi:MAG: GAF domain-containing protein [Chloroflexi bacterium]|nr:GAF domain-containing protein [Chloroflexota bacterium]
MNEAEYLILQNRLLSEEVKRRIDQMAAINIVASTVSQSLDLDRTLETALRAVLEVVNAESGGISLIDAETQDVVLRAQRGWLHDFVSMPMRIPFGKGMSGRVIREDNVVVNNNLDGSEEYAVPSFRDEHFRSIAMTPMHARGKIVGILSIMSNKPDSFSDEIVAVLRAVADTVGVALENARLYEARVEQENRLNAILQSSADGIITTDLKGRIELVNNTAETMLGVAEETLSGVPLREAPMPAKVRDSLLVALASRVQAQDKAFQVTLDDERVLLVQVAPVYTESQVSQQGDADGWVIVLQDVTHIRKAEIERARFMQAAAHDMRNPLGVALNSLSMLQSMIGGQDATADEIIGIATRSVHRLRDLIDDLLNLEHIESGFGFKRADADLREVLEEAAANIKPSMDSKGLHFSTDISDNIGSAKVDRRWLMRALMNYLDNAVKYNKTGRKVTLRAYTQDNNLHLEVIDNGIGIPAKAQSRLFDRFYRVDDKDTEGISGTGLGLAIVKSVAEAHGGKVYVRSRKGHGSTFGLLLPQG